MQNQTSNTNITDYSENDQIDLEKQTTPSATKNGSHACIILRDATLCFGLIGGGIVGGGIGVTLFGVTEFAIIGGAISGGGIGMLAVSPAALLCHCFSMFCKKSVEKQNPIEEPLLTRKSI